MWRVNHLHRPLAFVFVLSVFLVLAGPIGLIWGVLVGLPVAVLFDLMVGNIQLLRIVQGNAHEIAHRNPEVFVVPMILACLPVEGNRYSSAAFVEEIIKRWCSSFPSVTRNAGILAPVAWDNYRQNKIKPGADIQTTLPLITEAVRSAKMGPEYSQEIFRACVSASCLDHEGLTQDRILLLSRIAHGLETDSDVFAAVLSQAPYLHKASCLVLGVPFTASIIQIEASIRANQESNVEAEEMKLAAYRNLMDQTLGVEESINAYFDSQARRLQ